MFGWDNNQAWKFFCFHDENSSSSAKMDRASISRIMNLHFPVGQQGFFRSLLAHRRYSTKHRIQSVWPQPDSFLEPLGLTHSKQMGHSNPSVASNDPDGGDTEETLSKVEGSGSGS